MTRYLTSPNCFAGAWVSPARTSGSNPISWADCIDQHNVGTRVGVPIDAEDVHIHHGAVFMDMITTPFDITPFDITPFDITPFDITPFDITPFDITPFDITSNEN